MSRLRGSDLTFSHVASRSSLSRWINSSWGGICYGTVWLALFAFFFNLTPLHPPTPPPRLACCCGKALFPGSPLEHPTLESYLTRFPPLTTLAVSGFLCKPQTVSRVAKLIGDPSFYIHAHAPRLPYVHATGICLSVVLRVFITPEDLLDMKSREIPYRIQ